VAVDVSDLKQAIEDYAVGLADRAAALVVDKAKAAAPVSTPSPTNNHSGQLRDSLDVLESFESATGTGVVAVRAVGSLLNYAQFTDEVDTAPHQIYPLGTHHLRFWWDRGPAGAGVYYMPHVNHPGTTGKRWFASSAEAWWLDALQSSV